MGEALIPRKNSANSTTSSFAIIAVTYPKGSTCTCTSGNTTLTAPNTNGQTVFNVPFIGTWVINCTDGINVKSESVSIISEKQCETIELAYQLILFDSSTTGGWSIVNNISGYCSAAISNGVMTLTGSKAYGGADSYYMALYHYNQPIACTSGDVLKISVSSFTADAKLVVVSDPEAFRAKGTDIQYTKNSAIAEAAISSSGASLTLPEGTYYLGILYDASAKVTITKVWVE